MTTSARDLISRFRLAEANLINMIVMERDDDEKAFHKSDALLRSAFNDLLEQSLADTSQKLERIEFLLNYLAKSMESSKLIKDISDVIMDDVRNIAKTEKTMHKPEQYGNLDANLSRAN